MSVATKAGRRVNHAGYSSRQTAAGDHLPGLRRQQRQRLIGLTAQHDICAPVFSSVAKPASPIRAGRSRPPSWTVRLSALDPLPRHAQLRLRTTPEKIRGRRRNYEEVFAERIQPGAHLQPQSRSFHPRINRAALHVPAARSISRADSSSSGKVRPQRNRSKWSLQMLQNGVDQRVPQATP